MSAFLATTLLGEVGERRDEPKAERKIVLKSRVLRNNCLEGPFHTVPSFFVLRCSLRHSWSPDSFASYFISFWHRWQCTPVVQIIIVWPLPDCESKRWSVIQSWASLRCSPRVVSLALSYSCFIFHPWVMLWDSITLTFICMPMIRNYILPLNPPLLIWQN